MPQANDLDGGAQYDEFGFAIGSGAGRQQQQPANDLDDGAQYDDWGFALDSGAYERRAT